MMGKGWRWWLRGTEGKGAAVHVPRLSTVEREQGLRLVQAMARELRCHRLMVADAKGVRKTLLVLQLLLQLMLVHRRGSQGERPKVHVLVSEQEGHVYVQSLGE